MSRKLSASMFLLASTASFAASAQAQSGARLPIPEGIWVDVATQCGAASNVYAYGGGRFGNIYFFGPNQSMGPSDETEPVTEASAGRNGYTAVNGGPIEVKVLTGGRIAIRAYSNAEGQVWLYTMRACAPETLSSRMRAATARHVRAAAAPAAPPAAPAAGRAQPMPPGRWALARVNEGGVAAYVAGPPVLPAIVFRCDRGVASILFNTPADQSTAPRQITFVGTSSGRRTAVTFARDAQNGGAWAARPDRALRDLFTGGDAAVEVQSDGRSLATLSLAGSSEAIGQALAGCPLAAGPAPAPARPAPPPAPQPVAAAAVPPIGIAPGYYVEEGQPCGNPTGGIFFYDGRRFGMMYPPDTGREVIAPIGRPTRRGNLWVFSDGSAVQVLSPTRIRWSYEEMGPPRRLCAIGEVPASVRAR